MLYLSYVTGDRGEWKSWLKAQHSENEDHGIWSHHFTANRWGNSGWLYFSGHQNHCKMVIAAMELKDTYSLEVGFPGGSDSKASAHNAGDLGLISGLGRPLGEGNGNPLQYCCLENSMDGGAWWPTVNGVAKSWTWLNNFTFYALEGKLWPI